MIGIGFRIVPDRLTEAPISGVESVGNALKWVRAGKERPWNER